MIGQDIAAAMAGELFALPFAPTEAAITARVVRLIAERCVDRAHAQRAVDQIMESATACPTPAQLLAAIQATYREPAPERQRAGGTPTWRCLTCRDKGLYSRDITLRNGDTIGVCGPCPDCATGIERAQAEAARHAK